MSVMNDLPDDALRAQLGPIVFRRQSEDPAQQHAQPVVHRLKRLIHYSRDGGRRLGQLMQHQSHMQVAALPPPEHVVQHQPDDIPQQRLGLLILFEQFMDFSHTLGIFHRAPQHFGVKLQLVAEMVVNQGEVNVSAATDLPNSGAVIAVIGEYCGRRF